MSKDDVRFYLGRGLLQPSRRRRGRSGDFAYHQEHVDRLRFIARAKALGFSHEDIAAFVDPGLLTCGDVFRTAERRLRQMKELLGKDAPGVAGLEKLIGRCGRVGSRSDCAILAALHDRQEQEA